MNEQIPPLRSTSAKRSFGAGSIAAGSIATGLITAVAGLLLIISPLAMGSRFALNKYFVAIGIILLCLGLSFILHGAIDRVQQRLGK